MYLEYFLGTKLFEIFVKLTKYIISFFLISNMAESSKDSSNHDLFVTEFPKGSYDIDKYLQGRVHFALMDQIKLMDKLGKNQKQIEEEVMKMVYDIVSNFDPKKESESS